MTDPKRIQRKRTKGWRMPAGAVYVGRPSLWGNPWKPSDGSVYSVPIAERLAWCIRRYEAELDHLGLLSDYSEIAPKRYDEIAAEVLRAGSMRAYAPSALRGLDLACFCPLGQPCHADVLLEIANA